MYPNPNRVRGHLRNRQPLFLRSTDIHVSAREALGPETIFPSNVKKVHGSTLNEFVLPH